MCPQVGGCGATASTCLSPCLCGIQHLPHTLHATYALAGSHVLTITKLSEARYGAAWLQSISLPSGGRFLPPPPSPGMLSGRRMLFLGDSFT